MIRKLSSAACLAGLLLIGNGSVFGQKAPLDHSVYDGWETISSTGITKDGRYIYYSVNKQQGDNQLYVKNANNQQLATLQRPASVRLSADEQYLISLIKPHYADVRQARIDKKRPDEMPKDSLAILAFKDLSWQKFPLVRSVQLPEEKGQFIAFMAEKPQEKPAAKDTATTATPAASGARAGGRAARPEALLHVYHLEHGQDTTFERVDSYFFTKDGAHLFFVRTPKEKDSIALDAGIYYYDLQAREAKQISSGKGDYKNIVLDDAESQLAFLAYKGDDKAQIKPYQLYHYTLGSDSAIVYANEKNRGIPNDWIISGNGAVRFSKDGHKLFFGISPKPLVRDTTLVDFEHAKVDIWHWQDDYLQTQQLVNLRRDQNRTYLAVAYPAKGANILALTDEMLPDSRYINEGDHEFILATTDYGRRIETQWMTGAYQDVYLVSTETGERKMVKENIRGSIGVSPKGNFVYWYDREDGNWYLYNIATQSTTHVNKDVAVSFANEDNDSPDEPNSYGLAGWNDDESELYLNDKYDIWAFHTKNGSSRMLTNGYGRLNNKTFRYVNPTSSRGGGRFGGPSDPIDTKKPLMLSAFDHVTKLNGYYTTQTRAGRNPQEIIMAPFRFGSLTANEKGDTYIYTKESYELSPNLFVSKDFAKETQLSETNPQQSQYNWGTAELMHWTTPNGHPGTGILYKPEDFDPNKKYPVIAYFYEKVSDGLYSYVAPTPTPSRLNISFFVSNGYIVLAPDISYEIGYPGRSSEEYVNSGMQKLAAEPWVNEKKLAIQGQSWGGYQVAHLITRTDMYAAAWSGAPVVNMTSAYGGIRWQTGMNRQFQYERTQSRLGVTLWENPDLYIENSPLFYMDRVQTPVVIMHNDEDGAVPWYQGIEMFTALRRLSKPVWMLNYNGDAHNLVQRQNRMDIQRRQLEFFDHFLKDKPAAPWIERGVPAIHKGIDWGFGQ